MTVTEYNMWIEFCQTEPIGEHRADLRAAIVASTVANANPFRKGSAIPISDFLIGHSEEREMSVEESKAYVSTIVNAWNKTLDKMREKKSVI